MSHICFLGKTVDGADGPPRARQARDWRLLAFLVWQLRCAQRDRSPRPPALRSELADLVGFAPATTNTALTGTRGLLKDAGLNDFLESPSGANGHVVLTGLAPEQCDLLALLVAADAKDRAAAARLGFDAAARDELHDYLLAQNWQVEGRDRGEDKVEIPRWFVRMFALLGELVVEREVELELDEIAKRYLDEHIKRCATLDARRIGGNIGPAAAPLPLEEVYVSLRLGPQTDVEVRADYLITRDIVDGRAVRPAADDLMVFADNEGSDAIDFADLVRERRWVAIIGDPGAGKSTLLHWLALAHARALRAREARVDVEAARLGLGDGYVDLGPSRLPVLVRVADYAKFRVNGQHPSLGDFLGCHQLFEEDLPGTLDERQELVRRYLAAGRVLVLVDGLDEVLSDTDRQEIVEEIEAFTQEKIKDPANPYAYRPWTDSRGGQVVPTILSPPFETGGNQLIVTSRRHAYKQTPLTGPVSLVEARPLDRSAIERFCRRWALAVETTLSLGEGEDAGAVAARAEAASSSLLEAIFADRDVRRLASNPLLLTVLALIQRSAPDRRLPTRRLELYEQASRVLVERGRMTWTFEQIRRVLGPFALWLHGNSPTGYAPRADLEEHLVLALRGEVADPAEFVQDVLEAAHRHAGVLVELGQGLYGFAHNTVREYLAAVEVAQNTPDFREWLFEHIHDVLWIEVVLMAMAEMASRPDYDIDTLLTDILEHEPEIEELLHHGLLLVSECLADIDRGSEALVREVVRRLLGVIASSRHRGVDGLADRALERLAKLAERRPETEVALVEVSVEPQFRSAVIEVVLAVDALASLRVLGAVDALCRLPSTHEFADGARQAVLTRLHEAGADLPDELRSIGGLWEEGGPYEAAYAALEEQSPRVYRILTGCASLSDPAVYRLARWTLDQVDAAGHGLDPLATNQVLTDQVLDRVLGQLQEATGTDFVALGLLSEQLDVRRAHAWLLEAFHNGKVDAESCSGLLSVAPGFLPAPQAIPGWVHGLPPAQARALLQHRHATWPLARLDLAWSMLADPVDDEAFDLAATTITRFSARYGRVPLSPRAVDTIRRLVDDNEHPLAQQLARTFAGRLYFPAGLTGHDRREVITLLDETASGGDGFIAQAAAVILAQLSDWPLTLDRYKLIDAALTPDSPLHAAATAAFRVQRTDETVPDEVVEYATARSKDPDLHGGDAFSHGCFGLNVHRVDAERAQAVISADMAAGVLMKDIAEELIDRIDRSDAENSFNVLNACRNTTRSFRTVRLDLSRVELFVDHPSAVVREQALRLITEESVMWGDDDAIAALVERTRRDRPDDAALAVLAAATHAPAAADVGGMITRLESLVPRLSGASNRRLNAARLAVAMLVESDSRHVVKRLEAWTLSHRESAEALLDVVDNDLQWGHFAGPTGLSEDLGGVVPRRVALVTAEFAGTEPTMRALIAGAQPRCAKEFWGSRRAGTYLLDGAAARHPGLFLTCADGTGLREVVLAAASDRLSWSVRWLSALLVSRFRVLDQPALDVLVAASRDQSVAGVTTVDRCRSLTASGDLDLRALCDLVGSNSARAILVGGALLAATAALGRDERRLAIDTIAARLRTDDPLLDATNDGISRTTRDALNVILAHLIWKPAVDEAALDAAPRSVGGQRAMTPGEAPAFWQRVGSSSDIRTAITTLGRGDWIARPSGTAAAAAGLAWHDLFGRRPPQEAGMLYDATVEAVLQERLCAMLDVSVRTPVLEGLEATLSSDDGPSASATRLPSHARAAREVVRTLRAEVESFGHDALLSALEEVLAVASVPDAATQALDELVARANRGVIAEHPTAARSWTWPILFRDVGHRLSRLGFRRLALKAYVQALKEVERSNRKGDSLEYVIVHDIAYAQETLGEVAVAIDNYEAALEGKDRVRDLGHRDTLITLRALLLAIGRVDPERAAARLHREIERRRESNIAATDLDDLHAMEPLLWRVAAEQFRRQEDRENVRWTLARGLDAMDDQTPAKEREEHLLDLGVALAELDRQAEAEAVLEDALASRSSREPKSPREELALVVEIVACVAVRDGDEAQARLDRESERLLADGLDAEGQTELRVAVPALWSLAGKAAYTRGDAEVAEQALRRALDEADSAELLGIPLPDAFSPNARAALVAVLAQLKRTDEAEDVLEDALRRTELACGATATETISALFALLDFLAVRDVAGAEERWHAELGPRRDAARPGDEPQLEELELYGGNVWRRIGGTRSEEDAVAAFRRGLELLEESGRSESLEGALLQHDLAFALFLTDEIDESRELAEAALQRKDHLRGRGHHDSITTLSLLVDILAQADVDDALERLEFEQRDRAAELDVEQAARLEQVRPAVLESAAYAAVRDEEYAKGAALLRRALDLRAGDPELETALREQLAFVLGEIDDVHGSIREFRIALRLHDQYHGAGTRETIDALMRLVRSIAAHDISEAIEFVAHETTQRADVIESDELLHTLSRLPVSLWQREGWRLERAKEYVAALQAYRTALDHLLRIDPGDAVRKAMLHVDLGDAHAGLDEIGEAEAAYEAALELYDAHGDPVGPDTLAVVLKVVDLVAYQDPASGTKRAIDEYNLRGLAQLPPEVGQALRRAPSAIWGTRGVRLAERRNHPQAAEAFKEGLRYAEEASAHRATLSHDLGLSLTAVARVSEAIEAFEQSLDILTKVAGPGAPSTVDTLEELVAAIGRRSTVEAEARLEQEIDARRRALSDEQLGALSSLSPRIHIEAARGSGVERRFRETISSYEKALSLIDDSTTKGKHWRAVTIAELASVRAEMGESEVAVKQLETALALIDATFSPEHADAREIVIDLIDVMARCDARSALVRQRRELEHRRTGMSEEDAARLRRTAADLWRERGLHLEKLGDYAAADDAYAHALIAADLSGDEENIKVRLLRDRGDVAGLRNQYADSDTWYLRALERADELYGEGSGESLAIIKDRAVVAAQSDGMEAAAAMLRDAAETRADIAESVEELRVFEIELRLAEAAAHVDAEDPATALAVLDRVIKRIAELGMTTAAVGLEARLRHAELLDFEGETPKAITAYEALLADLDRLEDMQARVVATIHRLAVARAREDAPAAVAGLQAEVAARDLPAAAIDAEYFATVWLTGGRSREQAGELGLAREHYEKARADAVPGDLLWCEVHGDLGDVARAETPPRLEEAIALYEVAVAGHDDADRPAAAVGWVMQLLRALVKHDRAAAEARVEREVEARADLAEETIAKLRAVLDE